ncbi:MAG: hypothetical protein H0W95_06170 [Nocardioidaceae bacterium]|nr:hypothetical protein [Nocardioidaceae bacterium]
MSRTGAGAKLTARVTPTADHAGYIARFRFRVLQDAVVEALPTYWRRRADTFDLVGTSACDEIATACRHHADLLEQDGLPSVVLAELVDELDEAA